MKKIINFSKACAACFLITATLLLNYSFSISQYIEIEGLSKEDLTTSAYKVLEVPGQEKQYLRTEETLKIFGSDSCRIGLHLPGFYDPNTGASAPMSTRYPKKDVKVSFQFVEYVLPTPTVIEYEKQRKHMDYHLRFMAVSTPQWVSMGTQKPSYSLDSRTPFSLQNAMRLGARDALLGKPIWRNSNWSDKNLLTESVFLLNYFDEEKDVFIDKLNLIKPQILFLGSMTLSFPSAVEFARIAKEQLGKNVFTILGGKHVIETIYWKNDAVNHHPGSPTKLMLEGAIPPVFDLVVSGDGEEVVQKIGELLGADVLSDKNLSNFTDYQSLFDSVRGNIILSWINDGQIQNFVKQKNQLDYENLPSPVSLFGVNTSFPIFGKDYTAHVYSDMGKGCVFNCFFCSEKSGINGSVIQSGSPAGRLYRQLKDASEQDESMSAFIEDSIILMGLPKHLNELADLLEQNPLPIVFGGQFTVDNILNPHVQEAIKRLRQQGLIYVYTGMETADEAIATEMSKNTSHKISWIERNEQAVQFITGIGIKHGVSLLWGLGENQESRLHQLEIIEGFQHKYGNPLCVSPNWATQHPLFNQSEFNYVDWGTDRDSKYLGYFTQLFGEASEKYKLHDIELPTINELELLIDRFEKLNIKNV